MPTNGRKGKPRKRSKEMPTATAKVPMVKPVSLGSEIPNFVFVNPPKKHLLELTGNDVPPGVDPDELTIECEDRE
jgi:hypothetical protein